MSDYKVSVSNNNIKVSASTVKHETKVESFEYATSLSRVGGQGTKGDSISNVEVNSESELLITVSTSGGDAVKTFNLGVVGTNTPIGALANVDVASVADGEILRYDSTSTNFVNHTLTTTSVTDIDNTGKTDGAVLIYDGASSKYKSTVNIDNENTFIRGGSY